jgi:hypothetical protein
MGWSAISKTDHELVEHPNGAIGKLGRLSSRNGSHHYEIICIDVYLVGGSGTKRVLDNDILRRPVFDTI